MDNPYWNTEGQGHHIDLASLRLLAFDLLNVFEANRSLIESLELARAETPEFDAEKSTLLALHKELADTAIRQRLLQFALMIRTYDDLMAESDVAKEYHAHAKKTDGNKYIGVLEDADDFTLRDACNKIIHANVIRPLYEPSEKIELLDKEKGVFGDGPIPKEPPNLWHLTGEVELDGEHRGTSWDATIYVQPFIEIAIDRIGFGYPEKVARKSAT